jgi:predicted Rossmann-fold nucleotide-binding protein
MIASVRTQDITNLQNVIQVHGKTVDYREAGALEGRTVKARVVYGASSEVQNSIESYAIRVTLDARDFMARAPSKGDTLIIDGARRGIMQVVESHIGDHLVAFRCGVQG